MLKPSTEQLAKALDAAEELRASGGDRKLIAHAMLYLYERVQYLDKVRHAAELYLRAGLTEHEHSMLVRALDAAARADESAAEIEHVDFGLE